VKIATWNVNSVKSRLAHALKWCEVNAPEILCLQETKVTDNAFPVKAFADLGYEYAALHGERAYNGVAILSVSPLTDVAAGLPGDNADTHKRLVAASVGNIRVINAYVPNGGTPTSDKYRYKLKWLARLRAHLDKEYATDDAVVLCGDLNVAPHELDIWNPSLWKDKVHFTKPEREALINVKRWGFADLFRQMKGEVREYSFWDHAEWSFRKDQGMRIDHIWASQPLAERCTDCYIDKAPRAWERPSDHAPVVAEFAL
jgi:exodeoxyribonuclease III